MADVVLEAEGKPPDDELAKALPGLPVTVGRVRADESGLHYEGQDYSWDRVSSLTVRHERLVVEGRRLYRPSVLLFEASVVPEDARPLETAWREYLLRRIERDGALKGTAAPLRLERLARLFLLAALLVFAMGFSALCGALTETRAANPFERDLAASAGAFAMPAMFVLAAAFLLAQSLSAEREKRVLVERWKRWELCAEGLAVEREGARRLLAPGRAERVLRDGALVGGEPVQLRDLTGQPLLSALFLAMAERAGVVPEAGDVRGPARKLATGLLAAGLAPAAVGVATGETATGILMLSGAALVVTTLVILLYVSRSRKRREIPRMLEEGREALERLGW